MSVRKQYCPRTYTETFTTVSCNPNSTSHLCTSCHAFSLFFHLPSLLESMRLVSRKAEETVVLMDCDLPVNQVVGVDIVVFFIFYSSTVRKNGILFVPFSMHRIFRWWFHRHVIFLVVVSWDDFIGATSFLLCRMYNLRSGRNCVPHDDK